MDAIERKKCWQWSSILCEYISKEILELVFSAPAAGIRYFLITVNIFIDIFNIGTRKNPLGIYHKVKIHNLLPNYLISYLFIWITVVVIVTKTQVKAHTKQHAPTTFIYNVKCADYLRQTSATIKRYIVKKVVPGNYSDFFFLQDSLHTIRLSWAENLIKIFFWKRKIL